MGASRAGGEEAMGKGWEAAVLQGWERVCSRGWEGAAKTCWETRPDGNPTKGRLVGWRSWLDEVCQGGSRRCAGLAAEHQSTGAGALGHDSAHPAGTRVWWQEWGRQLPAQIKRDRGALGVKPGWCPSSWLRY